MGRYTCQNLEFPSESCGGMWGSCLSGLRCRVDQYEIAVCLPLHLLLDGNLRTGSDLRITAREIRR